MKDITAGYEKFIQNKEVKDNGKQAFNKAVNKATKPKQRGSK